MQIDYSKVVTAEAKATKAAEDRAQAVKAECERRIQAELDIYTLSNITSAASIGGLSKTELDAFKAGCAWVAAMQAACRTAIASGEDPDWPDLPDGVADLAAQY